MASGDGDDDGNGDGDGDGYRTKVAAATSYSTGDQAGTTITAGAPRRGVLKATALMTMQGRTRTEL